MRFASLGSGSEGNGLLVEAAHHGTVSTLLLDCGFTLKETERRLQRLSVAPAALNAILITHEHGDHISGVFRMARRYGLRVYASHGTVAHIALADCGDVDLVYCRDGQSFHVGAIEVIPYAVPHDAREPLQYSFVNGSTRLGVLTDAGHQTAHMNAVLSGCDALVLECNHDRDLLAQSRYPYSVRQRIGGAYGHLANDTAAEILASLDRTRLKVLYAAHLSRSNNTPELARAALAAAWQRAPEEIGIADQEAGFDWVSI